MPSIQFHEQQRRFAVIFWLKLFIGGVFWGYIPERACDRYPVLVICMPPVGVTDDLKWFVPT